MKTWSIESVVVGFLTKLEEITRPPRLGHDVDAPDASHLVGEPDKYPWGDSIPWPPEADLDYDDTPLDGAEQLSEREAEVDSWLPDELWTRDTGWKPEPPLTNDELVGVRGLLQERYGDQGREYDDDPMVSDSYLRYNETSPAAESETPAGERPAGVEHPPIVPPAGQPDKDN